jgi:aryl-phospho-beta-D-glucosidase BglC (GH1 family)
MGSFRGRMLVAGAALALTVVPQLSLLGAPAAPLRALRVLRLASTGLHTTGTDSRIYDAANRPVRLVGFNWPGTPAGGRRDNLKKADACGKTWRTPADPIGGLTLDYDDFYQRIRGWGYNVVRLPVSWHNLEPVAPVWNTATGRYVHTWNRTYLNDLESMVTKARAAGLWVVLDLHQDFWSPALHNISKSNGTTSCEGLGMPRWLNPSIDAKPATVQSVDFFNAMNWFFRNVQDPKATVTRATPWQLLRAAWTELSYEFSSRSGFAAYQAVIGADLFNEPYVGYVGANPPAGQSVLQAAGSRLRSFYTAQAPAVTGFNPGWLLFFEDSTGGYNSTVPAARQTPTMASKPTVAGNWVYSIHLYNFGFGTFRDGVTRHDDFGVNLTNAALANARAWRVPLFIGEFSTITLAVPATELTAADMTETAEFLAWAKLNNVSWTFWAYAGTHPPTFVIDYRTNLAVRVVRDTLAAGR